MVVALSSFEIQKRYWYFWNQETKMHQLRGGHMGLGTKTILEATLVMWKQYVSHLSVESLQDIPEIDRVVKLKNQTGIFYILLAGILICSICLCIERDVPQKLFQKTKKSAIYVATFIILQTLFLKNCICESWSQFCS